MTATAHSPLEPWLTSLEEASRRAGGAASARALPFLAQLDLRLEEPGRRAAERELAVELPTAPNRWSPGEPEAYWLGPDEWLLVAAGIAAPELERRARVALDGSWGAVVDVSDQRLALEVSGPAAAELLTGGIPIDLHERAFGAGDCAQTLLGRAGVLIARRERSTFRLFVRTTFAAYVAAWLVDALEPLATADHRPRGAAAITGNVPRRSLDPRPPGR